MSFKKLYTKLVFDIPGIILTVYLPSKTGSGGWMASVPKGYRIRRDKPSPTHDGSQRHYHIFANGEVVIINQD